MAERNIIYKLYDHRGQVYYGSTRQKSLRTRLSQHKCAARTEKSRSHLLFLPTCDGEESVVSIEEVERVPSGACEAQVRARERWWIENHECVNKNIPGRSVKDSGRAYYKNNPEKCREARRRWRVKNPTYHKEWTARNPTYFKEYYKNKKARLQHEHETALATLALEMQDDVESQYSGSESTASEDDGELELIYDARSQTVSFE